VQIKRKIIIKKGKIRKTLSPSRKPFTRAIRKSGVSPIKKFSIPLRVFAYTNTKG
jgi:hypothetical protein